MFFVWLLGMCFFNCMGMEVKEVNCFGCWLSFWGRESQNYTNLDRIWQVYKSYTSLGFSIKGAIGRAEEETF